MKIKKLSPTQLAAAYQAACMAELQALKPGNVHVFADGHGMTIEDFVQSAQVSADWLANPHIALGERIYQAAQATQQAVGQNTNLGVLLLCAPLIEASLSASSLPINEALQTVLKQTTIADAQCVADAIVLANPAGLHTVNRCDVHQKQSVTLLALMEVAQAYDTIAWQYSHGYHDIVTLGLSRYQNAMQRWDNAAWATTAVYLTFLAHKPDTHIARKYGNPTALQVMQEAQAFAALHCEADNPKLVQKRLLDWDAALKTRAINPGTSADLTVATLLLANLITS